MTEETQQFQDQLVDVEYRHAYAQDFLDMTLARQIRALRKARGWNQKQLADLLGTQQSRISEIEDEEYGALSIATLKDLARVFDVYLNVRFTSFSEMLTQVDRTSMADLVVPSYAEDPAVATRETFSAESIEAAGPTSRTQATRIADSVESKPPGVLANKKLRGR